MSNPVDIGGFWYCPQCKGSWQRDLIEAKAGVDLCYHCRHKNEKTKIASLEAALAAERARAQGDLAVEPYLSDVLDADLAATARYADEIRAERDAALAQLKVAEEDLDGWRNLGREIEKHDPMFREDRMILFSSSAAVFRGMEHALSSMRAERDRLRERVAGMKDLIKTTPAAALAAIAKGISAPMACGHGLDCWDDSTPGEEHCVWCARDAAMAAQKRAEEAFVESQAIIKDRDIEIEEAWKEANAASGPIHLSIYTTDEGRITSVVERNEDGDTCDREIDAAAVLAHVERIVGRAEKAECVAAQVPQLRTHIQQLTTDFASARAEAVREAFEWAFSGGSDIDDVMSRYTEHLAEKEQG
jgi:hypothetical protein